MFLPLSASEFHFYFSYWLSFTDPSKVIFNRELIFSSHLVMCEKFMRKIMLFKIYLWNVEVVQWIKFSVSSAAVEKSGFQTWICFLFQTFFIGQFHWVSSKVLILEWVFSCFVLTSYKFCMCLLCYKCNTKIKVLNVIQM